MTETIRINSEDKKIFEEFSGMNFSEGMKLLIDNLKYGGQLGLDPFWSEENQKHLQKSISEFEKGKIVTFSGEDWKKFANSKEIKKFLYPEKIDLPVNLFLQSMVV